MIRTSLIVLSHLVIAIKLTTTKLRAQTTNVGVNTATPKATLDVTGTSTTSEADGILVPRITKDNLALKDAAYGADQNGAMVFITDASSTTTGKTVNITATGFHFYNHPTVTWKSVNGISSTSMPNCFLPHNTSNSATFNTIFSSSSSATSPSGLTSFLVKADATIHVTFYSFEDEKVTYELYEVTPGNTTTFSTTGSALATAATLGWAIGGPVNASISYATTAGKLYSIKIYKTDGGAGFTSNGVIYTSFYAD